MYKIEFKIQEIIFIEVTTNKKNYCSSGAKPS